MKEIAAILSLWRRTAAVGLLVIGATAAQTADPLPSWNGGATKQAILGFVKRVTTPGGKDFVPVPQRIASFDDDGTLGAEQPSYFDFAFAVDRVKLLAPQHPEWQTTEPFASLLKGDLTSALAGGENSLLEIVMATCAGMTSEEWDRIVSGWLATARQPKTGMSYQPMMELVAYLHANGFKTYSDPGGNKSGAIIHIQVALLFPRAVRDFSMAFTEPE